jgi:hypothetical protein
LFTNFSIAYIHCFRDRRGRLISLLRGLISFVRGLISLLRGLISLLKYLISFVRGLISLLMGLISLLRCLISHKREIKLLNREIRTLKKEIVLFTNFSIAYIHCFRDRRGHDRMVDGFIINYAISAYHHKSYEFQPRYTCYIILTVQLIDWYLTPTLAGFQLYHGMTFFLINLDIYKTLRIKDTCL